MPDPWQDIGERFPVGSFHSGNVVRLANFGAFVNLAAGIDGLIHISRLGGGRRINHPKEVVAEGQTVDVKIEDIDQEQKRISLSLVQETTEDEIAAAKEKENIRRYMQKHDESDASGSMGTLGKILKAKLQEKENK
jgi:small subunit ribosomal protein S1